MGGSKFSTVEEGAANTAKDETRTCPTVVIKRRVNVTSAGRRLVADEPVTLPISAPQRPGPRC